MIKHTAKIHSMSLKEEQDLACSGPNGYSKLCALRLQGFTEHVSQMSVPPTLVVWVEEMIRLHGPLVRIVWTEMGWLEALMVVRYGEAIYTVDHLNPVKPEDVDGFVRFWPDAFSPEDVRRAVRWLAGETPPVAHYIPRDEEVLANPEE